MTKQDLENIIERYNKIYIIADDQSHKLLSTMKDDILTLINAVNKPREFAELKESDFHEASGIEFCRGAYWAEQVLMERNT